MSNTTSTASANTHSGAVSTGTPRHWAITPSSSSSSSGRDHDRHSYGDNHHHRTWGGPYTYSYGVDYSGHNTQQQDEADDQGFLAELARVQQNRQDDERRQRELDRQLADQRAADAAPPTVRNIATAPSSPTERESTVLVFKDQSQTEVTDYAVSGNMIYEFTSHRTRKIALSDLDIPATIAANRERGVEFRVPAESK